MNTVLYFAMLVIAFSIKLQQAVAETDLNISKTEHQNLDVSSTTSSTALKSQPHVSSRSRPPKVPKRLTTEIPKPEIVSIKTNKSQLDPVHEQWKAFQKTMKKLIDSQMKKALPKFLRSSSDAKLSAKCSKSMMSLMLGIRGMKKWAFRMLDASAKLPSGVLDGTLTDFGDFDQCLDVVKFVNNKKAVDFVGQYCTIETKPLLPPVPHRVQFKTVVLNFTSFAAPDSVLADFVSNANMFYLMSLRLGVCFPSTCNLNDIEEIVKLVLKDLPVSAKVRRCEVKEGFNLSVLQITMLCILGGMAILLVIGTYLDIRSTKETLEKESNSIYSDTFKSFSLKKNLRRIFKIQESKENFGVLNGTRTLSMVWVVLVHTYGFGPKQAFARMKNAQEALNEVTFGTIINAWVIVDTFFVLGAFLVAYSNLKTLERKNGSLNFTRYYLHRIWRLTPPVAGALLIMFLLPLLGSGPLWKDVIGREVGNCEKYWWQALIIPINTWTHFDDMCLIHTWYIASDLHFYFLAPLILIPLYKSPAIGFIIMLFFTMICMGVLATLTVINDFYPTLLYFTPNERFTKYLCDLMYFRPYPHMGAYCVGLALGYIVLKHRKVHIKPMMQVLGWCAAIACNLSVLYGAYEWNRGNLPNKIVDVTYAMFHRTAWGLGIAWLLFMCITGRGGLINKFLSWKLFVPLSRLSYSTYILHFPVLWVRYAIRRERLLFHHFDIFYDFLSTLLISICLSITFFCFFEGPFLNLEEVWFPRKRMANKNLSLKHCGTEKVSVSKLEKGAVTGQGDRVYSVRL